MSVLHVITGLATGGAQQVLHRVLVHGTSESGRVTVLSLGDEGTYGSRIRALGVRVYTLGMRRGLPGPAALARLNAVVRKTRPDCIHGWMYHGNLAAWLARNLAPGRPALAWNIRHSLSDPSAEKPLTRQVLRWNRRLSGAPEALIYNSHRAREQHETFGFCSGKGRVIPNGFDLPASPPDLGTMAEVRASVDLPKDALVVGHVARFHPMKDHAGFLRTAVRIAQTRDDVYVVLIGQGVTPDNAELTALIPKTLESRFRFLGARTDAQDLMRAMDVLCLSSRGEAFPNVLGEAMARGVPCVATDVGDSAALIGETGCVVAPRDDAALFRGLTSMLERTPDELRALGVAARERVEACFGMNMMIHQYDALERQLLRARFEGTRTPRGPL
ncbi:glycosyltransferase [Halofilum ochraceum]|uniref:glycosyltransferase n=1 Tax=Halofilum ochraceum TaxID=1611323 RepID=UPI0008DB0C4D|nr:glycosyltransferase [Halofilum ochraceum]